MPFFILSHRTRLSCGLAVALFALSGRAQEVSPSTLTLSAALARAVERNPGLVAQGYGERAAEALIEQAGFRPNPTLDVSVENFLGTGRVQGVRSLETTVNEMQFVGSESCSTLNALTFDFNTDTMQRAIHSAEST